MADEGFRIVITALNKTDAAFAAALRGGRQFAAQMRDVLMSPFRVLSSPSTMAFVYNIRAAVSGFEALYAAQDAQRQSALKLQQVLRSTGYTAALSYREIQDLASEMQARTTLDGDDVADAAAVMATFRNVQGDTFREGIRLAADMSATLGQDLQASVVMLGKALNDPIAGITAMTRAGVSFSASQKEQIRDLVASNRLYDAQRMILAELRTEFGGVAEAMAGGAGGQIKQIRGLIGDLVESIAQIAEPFAVVMTTGIRDWLRDANSALGEIVATVQIKFDAIRSLAEEAFAAVGKAMVAAFGLDASKLSATEAAVTGITRSVLAMAEASLLVKQGGSASNEAFQRIRGGVNLALFQYHGMTGQTNKAYADMDALGRSVASGIGSQKEQERIKKALADLGREIDRIMAKVPEATRVTLWDRMREAVRRTADDVRVYFAGAWGRATLSRSNAMDGWVAASAAATQKLREHAKEVGTAWAEAANQLRSANADVVKAQKQLTDMYMERRERDVQFRLARAGNNVIAQNRIHYEQAGWLLDRSRRAGSPEESMGVLKQAMQEAQQLRMSFIAQGGAPRRDFDQVAGLIGQIDRAMQGIADQQLQAAQKAQETARAEFDRQQRALAAANKAIEADERKAEAARKSSEAVNRFAGTLEKASNRVLGLPPGQQPRQNNFLGAGLDALLGIVF
ncbi:MAG TPA: phage tail length tape measure family protein [Phycisphaerae bacterium]|nr:phage tail length tape measure family protein [Phycisphaerae bacterium]HOM53802.1 phage tail length tape measure family protein [Phycisphaerae bacterium]HPP29266.1 phage tail length tape measure family protein [Phycisphaerae bacterium]